MRRNITPDNKRAEYLISNAKITLKRLNETDKEAYPSHTLIDYYTSIQYLLESICYKERIKLQGEGKHIELITIAKEKKYITQQEQAFLSQLREFRNKIHYEGFQVKQDYIKTYEEKILTIITSLLQQAKE